MFAVGRQAVIIDGRKDVPRPIGIADGQIMDFGETGDLFFLTASRFDGKILFRTGIHGKDSFRTRKVSPIMLLFGGKNALRLAWEIAHYK